MSGSQKHGRPANSRNVRVTPEFLEKPDIEKLARVLLAIAVKLAAKENTAKDEGEHMS